ncbi:hypothetical protein GCM10009801_73400 [Streptomyces albiaxialis]|uniref:AB hydrolase-1 domain-containing protein n=1 Tax=Streptomyces albiaxialis TaxID=329523 RepID=A0ABN2WXS0_9ACTN
MTASETAGRHSPGAGTTTGVQQPGHPPEPEDLYVPIKGGTTIHVRHHPGAEERPFLLVHGLASNARLWGEVAERLSAAGHPVYAVNLRGHGETEAPANGAYGTDAATADVAAVCSALELTHALVGGHSWGADIALSLAAGHPALVAGLALVDGGYMDATVVYETWDNFVDLLAVAEPDLAGATLPGIRSFLEAAHPDWSESAVEASLCSLRIGPEGTLSPHLSPALRSTIMRSVWDTPPSRLHPYVTQPVLLMPAVPHIDQERMSPGLCALFLRFRSSLAAAMARLPRAAVREYPGGDHDLHAQHPGGIAADMLDLARAVLRGTPLDDRREPE